MDRRRAVTMAFGVAMTVAAAGAAVGANVHFLDVAGNDGSPVGQLETVVTSRGGITTDTTPYVPPAPAAVTLTPVQATDDGSGTDGSGTDDSGYDDSGTDGSGYDDSGTDGSGYDDHGGDDGSGRDLDDD